MKKLIYIIFIIIFIIIIIFSNSNKITNKVIINDNVSINYPYFSNYHINNNILGFINNSISENNDKLIIDYDYKDNILTFYKRSINNNIVNEKVINYKIGKYIFEKINNDYYTSINDIVLNNNDNSVKYVALTFDDGPNYNTSKVIDLLNKYNAKATFFVMGKNIKNNELVLKKMVESGMEIGNHTYNHLLLTKYNTSKINEEINTTSELIYDVIGMYPTLFRPSYGAVNKKIKGISNYPIIIWNIDTLDWKYKNSKRIANTILTKIDNNDIILMHDIYKSTLNALDIVLPILINNNYKLVTVSELFYYNNISLEKGKVYGYIK